MKLYKGCAHGIENKTKPDNRTRRQPVSYSGLDHDDTQPIH